MEKILQYAWKWRLYGNRDLRLADGRTVRIIDPGVLNNADGPDFFNAKIILDGFLWAGNIEIHLKASDWWRHGHHTDPAYSNIILHVVAVDDARLTRPDGTEIPQLTFPLTPVITALYADLTADASKPPPLRCWNRLREVPQLLLTDAINSAAYERIEQKSQRVTDTLRRLDGDIAHTCLVTIARALGFGINADPFERTALALNLNYCGRHADDPLMLDAMVFGMAGLLGETSAASDAYASRLASEFRFLAHKYSLVPLPGHIWKRGGVRPANSPHRRLAYLSRLLPDARSLPDRIFSCGSDTTALRELLSMTFDGFWSGHYNFGDKRDRDLSQALSEDSLTLMLINAVAPLCHAFGRIQGDRALEERGADILDSLPAEKNTFIRDWQRADISPRSALESQGLLQLRKMYCDRNECLRCRIGNRLLRSAALPVLPVGRAAGKEASSVPFLS